MPDPWDPVRGAWVLLLALLGCVALQQLLVWSGCALFHVEPMCTRTGENLAGISTEVLAAVAILIGLGRKP